MRARKKFLFYLHIAPKRLICSQGGKLMETNIFLDKLKEKMPGWNYTSIHQIGSNNDDLVIATEPKVNNLRASFKFTGDMTYGLVLGNTVTFTELKNLIDAIDSILEDSK